ncbi:hypothetical protein K458DRAFT_470145 [Lentithecium fluviatile CBS 122367]|uniref:Uncharacterized protein n=1 Tax=Lentithecium fluviatile CBS 122367 TaxID=1168545 RepID=A0A6G1J8A5_9PLEO|nr:hypothetical protein K458DRAFT_470145 [Lentithecium fluviatile CBS 122367]
MVITTPFPNEALSLSISKLCGVKTQFIDDPKIASIRKNAEQLAGSYHQLRIVRKRAYTLQSDDGTDIALLNNQASKALLDLDRKNLVRYNAYVSAFEWASKTQSFAALGRSACLDVDIYFYGSHCDGDSVGKVLSNTGLFLQQPDYLDSSIPYDNPHELKFPSIDVSTSPLDVPMLLSTPITSLPMDMANAMLGNLDHQGDLVSLDMDKTIVKTELKPHQREALDFIAHRESARVPDRFSLFKKSADSRNQQYHSYEHTIIGTRKPRKPLEDFGGIIADEMGLGKTLTMIAAIARTLGRARTFVEEASCNGEVRRATKRTGATLVVCPAVLLMDGWLEEVSRHVSPGFLKCTKYHGTSKPTDTDILESDIVLTTYATLIADSSRNGVLQSIHWFRIVIDEAHSIRHQNTKQFRAVVALASKHRWCLTGTPIQNVLNDLGALVRFLRVPQLDAASNFYTYVAGPIEKRQAAALPRLRNLLRSICLRRTKDLVELPEPAMRIQRIQLTEEERTTYCRVGEDHRLAIDQAINTGNITEASSGLFRAILRLRIFCSSGHYNNEPQQSSSSKDEGLSLLEQEDQAVCAFCSCEVMSVGDLDSTGSGVLLSCSHLFCRDCVTAEYQLSRNRIRCVTCGIISKVPARGQESDEQPVMPGSYNSKLEALAQDVMLHRSEKCIIFSSWKKTIQVAASCLSVHGIQICMVDGSMPLPERRKQLLRFQSNPSIPALLMTLGTGAVGLNLTIASRVHILEPQWNPSIEKQAIGRVIRLGQEKQVTAIRYIADETVEQHIQTRQEKKLYLAQLGWDSSNESEEDKLQKVKVSCFPPLIPTRSNYER